MGFIKAPQSTYVPDLAKIDDKWMGKYSKDVWCCDAHRNHPSALYPYTNGKRFADLKGAIAPGDSFTFCLNMKDNTCEVSHNGKSLGVIFRDLPSEISPAVVLNPALSGV